MVGLKGPYGSEYCDRIFAHLLAKKRLPNQYAPASQTRHHNMYRTRLALIAASVVLVVASVFISGSNAVDAIVNINERTSAEQRAAFYKERVAIARERMPKTPAEPRDIKAAVQMADTLRAYRTTPRAMAVTLGKALAGFETIKLDSIDWIASTDQDKPVSARANRADVRRGSGSGSESGGRTMYQIADIDGRIDPFEGDYRAAIETVRAFNAALLSLPEVVAANVVEYPLDTSSETKLSGDTDRRDLKARFKLHVVIEAGTHESS